MNCKIKTFNTQKTVLAAAPLMCFSPAVYADTAPDRAEAVQQVEEIRVVGKKKVRRKEKDVTGLGKIVKTAETTSANSKSSISATWYATNRACPPSNRDAAAAAASRYAA